MMATTVQWFCRHIKFHWHWTLCNVGQHCSLHWACAMGESVHDTVNCIGTLFSVHWSGGWCNQWWCALNILSCSSLLLIAIVRALIVCAKMAAPDFLMNTLHREWVARGTGHKPMYNQRAVHPDHCRVTWGRCCCSHGLGVTLEQGLCRNWPMLQYWMDHSTLTWSN